MPVRGVTCQRARGTRHVAAKAGGQDLRIQTRLVADQKPDPRDGRHEKNRSENQQELEQKTMPALSAGFARGSAASHERRIEFSPRA